MPSGPTRLTNPSSTGCLRLFSSLEKLEDVDSTNDYLKSFIESGQARAVWARRQNAGKGQFGRHWHSPLDQGLYVSFLTFPGWPPDWADHFNRIASLSVLDAVAGLAERPIDLSLKKPNDIYVGHRKVAGILTELGSLPQRILWVITGIGINLNQTSFPPPLRGRATSLLLEGISLQPEALLAALTRRFEELFMEVAQGGGEDSKRRYDELLPPND